MFKNIQYINLHKFEKPKLQNRLSVHLKKKKTLHHKCDSVLRACELLKLLLYWFTFFVQHADCLLYCVHFGTVAFVNAFEYG